MVPGSFSASASCEGISTLSMYIPFSMSWRRNIGLRPVSSTDNGARGASPMTSETCSSVMSPRATRLSPSRPPFVF